MLMTLEQNLRQASDTLMEALAHMQDLETEKRQVPVGSNRFVELAQKVDDLALQILRHTEYQESIADTSVSAARLAAGSHARSRRSPRRAAIGTRSCGSGARPNGPSSLRTPVRRRPPRQLRTSAPARGIPRQLPGPWRRAQEVAIADEWNETRLIERHTVVDVNLRGPARCWLGRLPERAAARARLRPGRHPTSRGTRFGAGPFPRAGPRRRPAQWPPRTVVRPRARG